MKQYLQAGGILAAGIGIMTFAVWWQVSLWSECLEDHSFFYCMRVLSK